MNRTIFLQAGKLNENSFFIDVLYWNGTSYSKSLYPMITRMFQKYSVIFFKGGSYKNEELKLLDSSSTEPDISTSSYYIKRVIYTLIED